MGVIGYLDPGSGSIIAATAAAGLAGVGVAAKSMWQKQKDRFRKNPGDGVDTTSETVTERVADDR